MMSEFLQNDKYMPSYVFCPRPVASFYDGYEALDLCSSTCKLRNFTFADFGRVAE